MWLFVLFCLFCGLSFVVTLVFIVWVYLCLIVRVCLLVCFCLFVFPMIVFLFVVDVFAGVVLCDLCVFLFCLMCV